MAEDERLTEPLPRIVRIRRLCPRARLVDGGTAHTFTIVRGGRPLAGFVVAKAGAVHGFVNVCPHRGTPLDWQPGEVFEESGIYLICATHGALFEVESGKCVAGPCQGAYLQKIPVRTDEGYVVLEHDVLDLSTES